MVAAKTQIRLAGQSLKEAGPMAAGLLVEAAAGAAVLNAARAPSAAADAASFLIRLFDVCMIELPPSLSR
ncbi:hypothetical protein [Amycolatopsis magusensis]|uniref:hypothetical protein n=1 Tax=Amycolatopsis magusensis TaxID=882444 RepID=UPI0024A94D79|nr:hypothetical protein [Amycolatopsis magusensis]